LRGYFLCALCVKKICFGFSAESMFRFFGRSWQGVLSEMKGGVMFLLRKK
jgi:hypothetical protein